MHRGLGLSQPPKDTQALCYHRLRERALLENLLHGLQAAGGAVPTQIQHAKPAAADPLAHLARQGKLVTRDPKPGQVRRQLLQAQPGIKQGAQKHIPAYARETVEISDPPAHVTSPIQKAKA